MVLKKLISKKKVSLKNFKSLVPKKLDLNKIKVDPINAIENTKNKIGNFYNNFKKEREKEKKKLEKRRKQDQKKEL